MSTLTHSSRLKPAARAISVGRALPASAFSSVNEGQSTHSRAALKQMKSSSASPQFSATPRFRVLMAMEPARLSREEESASRFIESDLPDLEFREGTASLNHHWETLGFAINFIAIVAAIAYVMLT